MSFCLFLLFSKLSLTNLRRERTGLMGKQKWPMGRNGEPVKYSRNAQNETTRRYKSSECKALWECLK